MPKDNKYLSLLEAATKLGITRQWLRKRVQNGTAPAHITVGSRTIFDRESVEAEARQKGESK